MSDLPAGDPNDSRSEALARIETTERALEELAASVRSKTAELQEQLGQVRLSVIEMHSHAVSRPTPTAEPAAGGDDAHEGSTEGARLVALDLIGRGISTEQAKERLRETFPGVDADAVLRAVGATPDA
jgi:hypothetical protein